MSLEGAIAVTRFGLGARVDEISAASRAPKEWLLAQLRSNRSNHPAFRGLRSSTDIYKIARVFKDARKVMKDSEREDVSDKYGKTVRRNFESEIKARSIYAAQTDMPFHERLTRFWSNHFSISARNRNTRLFPGAYEREAIRPHILKSFYELAASAIFHPGMLVFLDNDASVGPRSRQGLEDRKGLNENLAREALELHTVTPAAGYTQTDVTEFAKALTGWRVERKAENGNNKQGQTSFQPRRHEPGSRLVLGKMYDVAGPKQALAILKDLCRRPETAENIAVKLAAHFVSDTPPPRLVEALKNTYLKTGGDLKALYETLVHSPLAWSAPALKIKTPEEMIISAARIIGFEKIMPNRPKDTYDSLAQLPFTAPTPKGWPDDMAAWLGPDAILKRIEWANELSSRLSNMDARQFLRSALGERLTPKTLEAVSRAESNRQGFVMALMSPEFQRR